MLLMNKITSPHLATLVLITPSLSPIIILTVFSMRYLEVIFNNALARLH